jgi:L-alanine-DL-glutamate epimerase-like enolase superfamily enzyme
MRIASYQLRPCVQRQQDAGWSFARGPLPELRGSILELRDDDGVVGLGYGHAIPTVTTYGEGVRADLEFLRPRVLGRDAAAITAIMEDVERALAGAASAKAAIDMALHDLVARRLGVGLATLLGGPLRTALPQSRIVPLKTPEAMAQDAVKLTQAGYRTVKVKLNGDVGVDVARVAAVRQAVGPEIAITLDANQSYRAKDMIRAFVRLETFDIVLIEQPVAATDWAGLAHVTRSLPVAVEADESAVTVSDVLRLVSERIVDVVNLKIPKLGGIRNVLAAAAICEAGGVVPRMGAAFGPALLQAASAQVASTFRTGGFAHELAEHLHLLDDPFTPLPVTNGDVILPAQPGIGVNLA